MPRKSNTRAAQGAGSIRQRPDGTWEARFVAGHDPGTGKPVRKSVYGKTQKEVRQKLAQAIAAVDNSDYFEPSKMTLSQWLDVWTAEYMGDKRYSTKKTYTANIETHIKPALGAVKLSQLVPHLIQRFYNELLTSGCKVPKRDKAGKLVKKDGKVVYEPAPMSAKTVRNIHGTLTKALSTAVDIGYLRMNPADRVTLPKVEKRELAPLTDEQVKAFLQAASNDELEIILKVILFTGLRESEALGLTWDCVDFKAGTVKVNKQLQKRRVADGAATLAPTKNGRSRALKPAPFVMALLEPAAPGAGGAAPESRCRMAGVADSGGMENRPGVHHTGRPQHFPKLHPLSLQEGRYRHRRPGLSGARSPSHIRRPLPSEWGRYQDRAGQSWARYRSLYPGCLRPRLRAQDG